MAKAHQYLRGLIVQNGDTQCDAAHAILLSESSFSQKMNYKQAWTTNEMYGLMDRYHEPYANLYKVFPKMGRSERA